MSGPQRILIVEDEPLIAMMLEDFLDALGKTHSGTADSVAPALDLIAAGGIETADDAWERITAGATLIQAYTGFIYGGPGWPRQIQDGLARRVRDAGLTSIAEAGTLLS